MHAGAAASGVRTVHEVVVHQRACLQPLESGGRCHDARLVGIAAGHEPTGVAELGAQALAAGDEGDRGVREVIEIRSELGEDQALAVDE